MRKWTKISLFSTVAVGLTAGIIALPFSLSVVGKNELVFGNFQAYMSPELMNTLQKKYDINWAYYGTNAEIPTYVNNKTFALQVATNNMAAQLALQGKIQRIDWSKFHLWNNQTNSPVTNYWDLKGVVTPVIWNLCEQVAQECGIKGYDHHEGNLLEYSIPYFLQDFVFAYRGPKIKSLNSDSSFYDIFKYITDSKIKNNRFLGGNSKVMMVKDARTEWDVAKLIREVKNNVPDEQININPGWGYNSSYNANEPISKTNERWINHHGWTMKKGVQAKRNDAPDINWLIKQYETISNFYKGLNPNTITLNTNSSPILNKLASNQIKGAFLYNGDAVYSAAGGDNASNTPNLPEFGKDCNPQNEFHFIMPKQNFLAMDGITIDSYTQGQQLQKVYQIAYDVSLSGLPTYKVNSKGQPVGKNGQVLTEAEQKNPANYVVENKSYMAMGDEDKDGNYTFGSMQNFDFVNYTPCYQNLLTYATKVYFGPVEADITKDMTPAEKAAAEQSAAEQSARNALQSKLLNIQYTAKEMNGKVDLPVNELTFSNMNLAFSTFNDKI
ncbi:hypothetical protein [Ureaplasma ceti]|uniref:Lipoprotein n=1 Tax=Ureaplasma ceti TaxID=3119530 RepID=A0ABP9U7K9_9BACT